MSTSNALTRADIQARIPHRPPILLLDEVTDYALGEHITATRYFPVDDPCFAGHFPGSPILPGMLTLEAIAQASAVLIALMHNTTADSALFMFLGLDAARFKRPIHPEDTVTLQARLVKSKTGIFWFDGQALVDGKVCATVSFSAKFIQHETV